MMGPKNRRLHSPNPLDQFCDPLDQPNAKWQIEDHLHPLMASEVIDVRALRERLRITQRQFAGWFGFPVATLRHWERGNRTPAGTALVLLHVIRENPRAVLQAVRKARKRGEQLAAIEPKKSYRVTGFTDRPPARRPRGPRRPKGA